MNNGEYSREADALTPTLLRLLGIHRMFDGLARQAMEIEAMLPLSIPSRKLIHKLYDSEHEFSISDPIEYNRFLREKIKAQPDLLDEDDLDALMGSVSEGRKTLLSPEDFV